ncbi:MAG TPA: ABC transporter permease [Acidimicrobiales bacterium]|nr:ABC transporter permease [Acidimicrobiales bacterium]
MTTGLASESSTGTAPGLRPEAAKGASFVGATLAVCGRTVKKFMRTPALVVTGTLSGLMFLLIFRYVFGGAVSHTGAMSYVDFVVPGFVTTSLLFTGMGGATGIAEDLQEGLVDRLRSLPIPQLAIVCGRVLADTILMTWGLLVMVVAGFAVGFRIHGGIGAGLEALGLCIVWGFAFCWLFVALGLVAGTPQGAQGLSFLVFPFSFISSAYVPVSTMPGWMQGFAQHQPLTVMVNSARILTQGHPAAAILGHGLGSYLPISLLWTAAIIAVMAPMAVWRLRQG